MMQNLCLPVSLDVLYRWLARGFHMEPTRCADHNGRICSLWCLVRTDGEGR